MKTLMLLCFLPCVVMADDFKTIEGDLYTNAVVKSVDPDGLRITYADGVTKLKFKDLAPEVQQKYGYDPAKATAYQAQQQADKNALAIQEKVREMEKLKLKKMEENSSNLRLRVIQCTKDGFICTPVGFYRQSHTDIGGCDYAVWDGYNSDKTIFLRGVNEDVTDGSNIVGRFYSSGKYQYTSVTGAMRTIEEWKELRGLNANEIQLLKNSGAN